jgi:hypothetical protein
VTDTERLLRRLRAMGADLPPCTKLQRTYRNSRSLLGTWSWFAYCPLAAGRDPEHHRHADLQYGSHWPIWVLLRAKGLTFQSSHGGINIDPEAVEEAVELWRAA